MTVSGFNIRRGVIAAVAAVGILCGAVSRGGRPATCTKRRRDAVTGAWELSNADHDKVCRITFRADAVAGGTGLDLDRNGLIVSFHQRYRRLDASTIWGRCGCIDAQSNAVLELTEVESGIFDGFQPGEGRYVLQSAAASPVRSAEDMIGDWAVARGAGKPICLLTLVEPAGG